jgi:hypothetical protein
VYEQSSLGDSWLHEAPFGTAFLLPRVTTLLAESVDMYYDTLLSGFLKVVGLVTWWLQGPLENCSHNA